MEREIEDLTTQQPEVLLVPEGIQLNYEFMGMDLLVLVTPDDRLVVWPATVESGDVPWDYVLRGDDAAWWNLIAERLSVFREGADVALRLLQIESHLRRSLPLVRLLAAMSEPTGDGEHHQDQDNDEQDGSEVHADLVPASEEIEP